MRARTVDADDIRIADDLDAALLHRDPREVLSVVKGIRFPTICGRGKN